MVTSNGAAPPKCTRCAGSLTLQRNEEDERVLKCTSCGREHKAPTTGSASPPAAAVAPSDWQATVRQQVREAIVRWQRADESKREAERLTAALAAYGATNLPELPWKTAKPKAGSATGGKGAPRNWGSCERCGVQLSGVASLRITATGRVCKNETACMARLDAAPQSQPARDDQAPAAAAG